MYPLPVYVYGCSDDLRQELLGPVSHAGASIAGVVASPEDVSALVAKSSVLFIVASGPDAVRAVRTAAPQCPVLALTEPAGFVAAMDAGANQAVLLPLEPGDLEAALGAIAEQYHPAAIVDAMPEPMPDVRGGGRVIAVTSACGGAGATTLAVNLAVEIADLGVSVVLAEPTQPVGRLALFLDAHPAFTTADLLSGVGPIDMRSVLYALHPVTDHLRLLASEYRVIPSGPLPTGAAARLVAAVRDTSDITILDLPCTYDDTYYSILTGADAVLLVGVQRLPEIRALQMLVEVLIRAGRESKAQIIVNQYDPNLTGFTATNIQAMLQGIPVATVANDPKAVAGAVNAGKPLKVYAPRSPARDDIVRLARAITGAGPAPEPAGDRPAPPPLLGRLARAFGLAGHAKDKS